MADEDDAVPIAQPEREETKKGYASLLTRIKWKNYILLFILFILLTSNVMTSRILTRFPGAIDSATRTVAPYGVVIQGICLVISFAVIEALINEEFI